MLDLDDTGWAELHHAYGDAADIPDLLRSLADTTGPSSDYEEEPWFSLWSSLCHQDDVYTASYAAVPHIAQIASAARGPLNFSFFQFPAAVELARVAGRGPEIPEVCAASYHQAIERLVDVIGLHIKAAWDEPMLLSAFAALAVNKGHIAVGEAMLNLDSEWIGKIRNNEFE